MAIEYGQLRRILLTYLKANPVGYIGVGGVDFVRKPAEELGLTCTDEDRYHALDILHDLYREGVIVSGSGPDSSAAMTWPSYRVTDYGHQVLSQKDYVPHDPDGYLAQLKEEIPTVDRTIIRYLEEALGCFKAGHLLASAVMTGCAAEKTMLLLIDAFGAALTDPDEKKKFESVIRKSWMISRKYDEFWKRLQAKLDSLPAELTDDLHVILDRAFDLIRSTRNDAGHPTGKQVDRDTVRANFILFPTYCRRMYALIGHFSSNPSEGKNAI